MRRFCCLLLCLLVSCSDSKVREPIVLGELINDPRWDKVAIIDHDEKIRSCMALLGFKYFGNLLKIQGTRRPNQDSADPETLRSRGYGVTDSMIGSETQLIMYTNQDPRMSRYFKALSESDVLAFWTAMYGKDKAESAMASEIAATPGVGCVGQAGVRRQSDLQARLQKGLNSMEDRLRADQEVLDVMAVWRGCMKTEGLPYKDRYEIVNELMERIGPIMSNGGVTSAAFKELDSDEQRISSADANCWAPNYAKYLRVRRKYEHSFRLENTTDLTLAESKFQ